METQGLIQWLLDNGGPVIRYRTAAELAKPGMGFDLDKMAVELEEYQEVKKWLGYLDPGKVNPWNYHGSADACFENAISMLVQFGMRAGMAPLDERTAPLRNWLAQKVNADRGAWDVFPMTVFASFLAAAGYRDAAIFTFLNSRLEVLYAFACEGCYDIYADAGNFKGVPQAFRGRPIINPELYKGQNYRFPLIYDIYGLAAMMQEDGSETPKKIESVIRYILTPEYHEKIVDGYGIVAAPGGKYHSMGWDAKVPGFFGVDGEAEKMGALLLQRMLLLSHVSYAVKHPWFKAVLDHLETFRIKNGNYAFPKHYLAEKEGYWVCGMHMGLGENRRSKIANELESTFWMLKIKKVAFSNCDSSDL